MAGIPVKVLIRILEAEGKKTVSNEDIKAKWDAYEAEKRRFAASHEPCACDYCGKKINPGNELYVDYLERIFCSESCVMAENQIYELSFQMDGVDDDGYREYFAPKAMEAKNDE